MDHTIQQLVEQLRFPAISCEPARAGDVAALAHRIRDDLEELGLDNARVLELGTLNKPHSNQANSD